MGSQSSSGRYLGYSAVSPRQFYSSVLPPFSFLVRSIPIVSKLDFTNPATGLLSNHTCGVGIIAWNTVAASPFAKKVSVNTWQELPALLDRLQQESAEYINNLQVKQKKMSSRQQVDAQRPPLRAFCWRFFTQEIGVRPSEIDRRVSECAWETTCGTLPKSPPPEINA